MINEENYFNLQQEVTERQLTVLSRWSSSLWWMVMMTIESLPLIPVSISYWFQITQARTFLDRSWRRQFKMLQGLVWCEIRQGNKKDNYSCIVYV